MQYVSHNFCTIYFSNSKYKIIKRNIFLQLEEGKYPIVLPLQLRKKQSTDSKVPQYAVISEKNNYNENVGTINVSNCIFNCYEYNMYT